MIIRILYRIIFLFVLLLSCIVALCSQDCYLEMSDFTGFNTSPYQESLNLESCELLSVISGDNDVAFKVIDYSFYIHNINMSTLISTSIQDREAEALELYDGHLLFNKVSSYQSIYDDILISIHLPRSLFNTCYSEIQIKAFENSVLYKM